VLESRARGGTRVRAADFADRTARTSDVVGGVHVHVAVAVKVHDHDHEYDYGSGALSSLLIASLGSGTCGGLVDLLFGLVAGGGAGAAPVEPFATPDASV
jgi:hypothetical protein